MFGSVSGEIILVGSIKPTAILSGIIRSGGSLRGTVATSAGVLIGSLIVSEGYDHYIGGYEVTPKIDSTTLPTADKVMHKDITIRGVPYYKVTNQQGGTTFIIAEVTS